MTGQSIRPAGNHASSNRLPDAIPEALSTPGALSLPPLIIVEGFLSAAQSVVWGNEFRTYLGIGHQQHMDRLASNDGRIRPKETGQEEKRKRRSQLGSNRMVVFAPIGPVSSLHDRACELFYALRGGTVDYGAQHAKQHGHSRWGRMFEAPLCPIWGRPDIADTTDTRLPAHFLGHSLGGPTILKLQQLLRKGFFDHALKFDRSEAAASGDTWRPEDLLLSITAISSPFRGTPLVYSLGSEPIPEPKVRFLSLGNMVAKAIHVAAYLELPFLDTHADAWHFSRRRRRALSKTNRAASVTFDQVHPLDQEQQADQVVGHERKEKGSPGAKRRRLPDEEEALYFQVSAAQRDQPTDAESSKGWTGLRGLLRQLWKSDWAEGRDCAPWDCTLGEREKDSREDDWGLEPASSGRVPRTWYRSYAGYMTTPAKRPASDGNRRGYGLNFWARTGRDTATHAGLPHQRPESFWNLSPFTLTSYLIGKYDYGGIQPPPAWLEFTSDGKVKPSSRLRDWYCNDGVVPLASQFHPGECDDATCHHSEGILSTLLVDRHPEPLRNGNDLSDGSVDAGEAGSCPARMHEPRADPESWTSLRLGPPAGPLGKGAKAIRPSLGRGAQDVATIALSTTGRAFGLGSTTLSTPSEEELDRFLPSPVSAADTRPHAASDGERAAHRNSTSAEKFVRVARAGTQPPSHDPIPIPSESEPEPVPDQRTGTPQGHRALPLQGSEPNKWYTIVSDQTDHATLCPFWTGSDLQKQFWTGIGAWLADVDHVAGLSSGSPWQK